MQLCSGAGFQGKGRGFRGRRTPTCPSSIVYRILNSGQEGAGPTRPIPFFLKHFLLPYASVEGAKVPFQILRLVVVREEVVLVYVILVVVLVPLGDEFFIVLVILILASLLSCVVVVIRVYSL